MSDCLPVSTDEAVREFKEKIEDYIKRAEVKVAALSTPSKNKFEARKKELKIKETLDIAKSIGD